MIWAYLVCLGGLILVSVPKDGGGKPVDLRRSWTIACWFPLVLILPQLLIADGGSGRSARELMMLNSMKEIVGWALVMALLFSMKGALASSRE